MRVNKYGNINDLYGWKNESELNKKIYDMWRSMWRRCGYEGYWIDCKVCDEWIYLSNFVKWIESEPRYEDFKKSLKGWSIDKDMKVKNNRLYSPDTCTLVTLSENVIERNTRKPSIKKPIIGISSNKIILLKSSKSSRLYGFTFSNISACLHGRLSTHKGFKWYYVNYNSTNGTKYVGFVSSKYLKK